jgi:hypothetical protein
MRDMRRAKACVVALTLTHRRRLLRVHGVFVRVFVFDTLVLLVEQCASFPCLSLGGHSSPAGTANLTEPPRKERAGQPWDKRATYRGRVEA